MSSLPLLLLAALAQPQAAGPATLSESLADGQTRPVEQVLFILNEELITSSMVEEYGARLLKLPKPPASVEAAMSAALADLTLNLVALEGFRRLGLDEAMLEEEVTMRMNRLIEEAGSRARFEDGLRSDGFTVMSFREWLKAEVVKFTWRSVVTGQQPSPLEGFRSRLQATPAEIREEFDRDPKRWEQGFSLVWEALQFHDSTAGPGLARAEAVSAALRDGSMSLAEAKAGAQSAVEYRGDPAERSLRPEIRDFLLEAPAGGVSAVEPIPNLGGMLFVVVERSPARTIGFEEAQARISADLKKMRSDTLAMTAAQGIYRTSYTWYPPELEGFMSSLLGVAPDPRETEF